MLNEGTGQLGLGLGTLAEIWGLWDFLVWRKVQRGDSFFFHLNWSTVFEGKGAIWVDASPIKQTICTDSWWFPVDCLPPSHIFTHSSPIAPAHSFHYLSSWHLGFHFIPPAQKQQKTIIQFLILFSFFILPRLNSPIPCMDGDCYTSDRTSGNVSCWTAGPRESQVDTWRVIRSQLCPRVWGSALGQTETVAVEV